MSWWVGGEEMGKRAAMKEPVLPFTRSSHKILRMRHVLSTAQVRGPGSLALQKLQSAGLMAG